MLSHGRRAAAQLAGPLSVYKYADSSKTGPRSWQQRSFLLRGRHLSYSSAPGKPQRTLRVQQVRRSERDPTRLKVDFAGGTLHVRASSGQLADKWFLALRAAVDATHADDDTSPIGSLDTDLYARQLHVFDEPAMEKLANARVLVVGMRGLGCEVVKNLVLSGVGSITLSDDSPVLRSDPGSCMFLSARDVGKPRAHAVLRRITDLADGRCTVALLTGQVDLAHLRKHDVVVMTTGSQAERVRINRACRDHDILFLGGEIRGLFSSMFVDFGRHYTHRVDGEDVRFRFSSLARRLKYPGAPAQDTAVAADKQPAWKQQLVAFLALDMFISRFGVPPFPGNTSDLAAFIEVAEQTRVHVHESWRPSMLDAKLMIHFATGSSAELAPMATFVGARLAHEVLKGITTLGVPLSGWMLFDQANLMPSYDDVDQTDLRDPEQGRYAGYAAVFSKSTMNSLCSTSALVMGGGAVANEVVRVLAMMGVASSAPAMLHLGDAGTLLKQHVPSMCLTRMRDVGKARAKVIASAIKSINSDVTVRPHQHDLEKRAVVSDKHFTDHLFDEVGIVMSCLESEQPRRLLEDLCVRQCKPLIDGGIDGPCGSVAFVVPRETDVLFDSVQEPRPVDVSISTAVGFPRTPEHVIKWARHLFDELFYHPVKHCKRLVATVELAASHVDDGDSNATKKLATGPAPYDSLEDARKKIGDGWNRPMALLVHRPISWDQCVLWARELFDEQFVFLPRKLLQAYPAEHQIWTRCPMPQEIHFDTRIKDHVAFVYAAADLAAYLHGVSVDRPAPRQETAKLAKAAGPEGDIGAGEAHIMNSVQAGNELQSAFDRMVEAGIVSAASKGISAQILRPDASAAVEFVRAAARVRCGVYSLPPPANHIVDGTVFNIKPTLVTTASMTAALMCMELLRPNGSAVASQAAAAGADADSVKAMLGAHGAAFNLADNQLTTYAMPPAPRRVLGDWTFTAWDSIVIDGGGKTIGAVIAAIENALASKSGIKTHVSVLTVGPHLAYMEGMWKAEKVEERRSMPIKQFVLDSVLKRANEEAAALAAITTAASADSDPPVVPVQQKLHEGAQLELLVVAQDASGEDVDDNIPRLYVRFGERKARKPTSGATGGAAKAGKTIGGITVPNARFTMEQVQQLVGETGRSALAVTYALQANDGDVSEARADLEDGYCSSHSNSTGDYYDYGSGSDGSSYASSLF